MKTKQDALEAFNKWMDSAGCLEQRHFDNGDIRIELARSADTIRKALTENTWRDIKDAPRDGTFFLAINFFENQKVVNHPIGRALGDWCFDGMNWSGSSDPFFTPTHWQPLPDQPPC